MRLYTDPTETEVLLDAVKLLKYRSGDPEEISVCNRLVERIERCKELQRPDCGRKDKQKQQEEQNNNDQRKMAKSARSI